MLIPQSAGSGARDGHGVESVDVCLCTFQRASIATALQSVAAQTGLAGLKVHVIVADNDVHTEAKVAIDALAQALGLRLTYVHAPSRNISIARNACLDAVEAPLAAFLDDDEIARPDWLANLIQAMDETGAGVVFGDVHAVYPPQAPAWLVKADLHSIRPVVVAGGVIKTGYTSNCLIRVSALQGRRFDLDLGRSGGEDTVFFSQLFELGVKLGHAPRAVVDEPTARSRATLGWLAKRSFRSGQTHGRMLLERDKGRFSSLILASLKAVACLAGALVLAGSPAGWRRLYVRAALHAGVTARLLGLADLQLY
jgi:succinoglycan biosynthesis protein ExoM